MGTSWAVGVWAVGTWGAGTWADIGTIAAIFEDLCTALSKYLPTIRGAATTPALDSTSLLMKQIESWRHDDTAFHDTNTVIARALS